MAKTNPTSEIGKVYGGWTVLAFSHRDRRSKKHWVCRCECGIQRPVAESNLKREGSHSCGCRFLASITKHGALKNGGRSGTWTTWNGMIQRCYNPRHKEFHNYGARGISICERWRYDFAAFLADMGEKPPDKTIDRIDNNGNYEPGNCRWATDREQTRNKRVNVFYTHDGASLVIADWAVRLGVKKVTIRTRMRRGWTFEQAILTPVGPRGHKVKPIAIKTRTV